MEHLKTIKAPTVILQGEADPIVSVAAAKELAAQIPGADLRLVPGLGHDTPAALIPAFTDAITAAAKQTEP